MVEWSRRPSSFNSPVVRTHLFFGTPPCCFLRKMEGLCENCKSCQLGRQLSCTHWICSECERTLLAAQQKHTGRVMHDNNVSCPHPGCGTLLFETKQWDLDGPNTLAFLPIVTEPLSNFYPSSFELDGKRWPSVEHFMQGKKFEGTPNEELIRQAKDYHEAHLLGWTCGRARADWDQVKLSFLSKALHAKFFQNQDCKEILLASEGKTLVQADTDLFWGANALEDVTQGQNWMGIKLMEVRNSLFSH